MRLPDVRSSVLTQRTKDVRRIVAVAGGKGGIGKSSIAATLAVMSARRGSRTGLLDLDLTGPSCHVILGGQLGFPKEQHGVEPTDCSGVRFLSIAHFLGDAVAPLRGADVTNAILEMLAIARWGSLDLLVLDMPPGLGDTTLDVVRFLPRAEFLIVTTPSKVALETVKRSLAFLTSQRIPIAGIVENMSRGSGADTQRLGELFRVPFLGSVPDDAALEDAVGSATRLADTPFAQAVEEVGHVLGGAR